MAFALTGARLFDGESLQESLAVVVEGARIAEVLPEARLAPGIERHRLGGGILAPGFIDVQVNGGGGALLNDNPGVDTVQRIAASHRRFGTTGLLPTVITDTPQVLAQAMAAVKAARAAGTPGVLGIHIEGPFLDMARKGAHQAACIRLMNAGDAEAIANAGCGVMMLTLAPNRVSTDLIRQLVQHGVRISLGHSDAKLEEIQPALAAGASAFTHLFNAMSQISVREPGMVGAALQDRDSYCGLIADGFHVHDACLRIALAAKPRDRLMLVTDAMPTAAGGPDTFTLQGRRVRRENGRLLLDDDTLAGSDLTMDAALRYCVTRLDVPLEDALRMASLNPAGFIGAGHELGRIQSGYLASLVHLRDDLTIARTWINGQ